MAKIKWLSPESFVHPAKARRGVLNRLFDYLFKEGHLKVGDTVVDPFGGMGTTGIIGATRGLRVICHELKPKFVALGHANFELNRNGWEMTGKTMPIMIQGDSRHLAEAFSGKVNAMVGMPPGNNPSQLAKLPFDGSLSSPPWNAKEQPCASQSQGLKDYHDFTRSKGTKRDATMTGDTVGQLGSLPMGEIGGEGRETFWSVARTILEQCHLVLKPGGVAVFILKDFVRNHVRVPFCDDWCKLVELCGFTVQVRVRVHRVEKIVHDGFEEIVEVKEEKGFFVHVQEMKGAPKIDWDGEVIAVRSP